MTPTRTLMLSTALVFATAAPSLADLTAEQVLADQLRQLELYGLTPKVTNQTRSGDTITVDGLTASMDLPEGAMRVTIGGASFRENGDGTVEVTYPDTIPISFAGTAATGEDFEMMMSLTQTNMRMTVSGIPEEINYDLKADNFGIEDLRFLAPEEAAEMDMTIAISAQGLSALSSFIGGGPVRSYTADMTLEGMTVAFSGMPEGEGEISVAFEMQDIAADYGGSVAPQNFTNSFADAIQAGNRTEGTVTHGAFTYSVTGEGPDGTFDIAAAVASGQFDVSMNEAGLDYTTLANDMTLSVGGSFIPLPPLTFKMAESGMRFAMPVVPSENEQNFALRLNLGGLEVDQMLWAMIDPTGQIARDPANLLVDLDGDVVLTEDVFAPEFAEQMSGPPGQINTLNINEILLNLAGAELTGNGDFSFNNSGPVPMPSGVVNLMLTGGNGLIDKLVGMGLLPEEQAMGARMMMSMFARPGDGPDTLVSTIEMNEDGSVLANGQRIR